jgi:starch-binding outer membrane protein, SusD/RagB family
LVSTTVYASNATAAAAFTSIYDRLASGGLATGNNSISLEVGLAADELKNYSVDPVLSQFYGNSLSSTPNVYFWPEIYQQIYVANAAIEGLEKSSAVTPNFKKQLLGEARFMRAFLYFYAVNLYGDVPLALTTDYRVNNVLKRTPKADVYEQIVADLKEAQSLLGEEYLTPTNSNTSERVRPNKGAATALLSRVYLYMNKWTDAETQAASLIDNSLYTLIPDLDEVFVANSNEAIWQLQPVAPGYNTLDAYYFVLTSPPGTGQLSVALSPYLLNKFETGDSRFNSWVGSFTDPVAGQTYKYPNKYKINTIDVSKPVTEYVMVLRLAEQYLIRAEARANIGNLSGAAEDLNVIRKRAGLPDVLFTTQSDLLEAIYHERQIEFFSEWGHRWFDLKRAGTINAIMNTITPLKGGVWKSTAQLLPIPLSETKINPNLTQNIGY